MQTSQKLTKVYQVVILRTNGDHLSILETDNFQQCFSKWEELHTQWQECVKNNCPYIIQEPIITAFTPSMIYEISVVPVAPRDMNKTHNPYERQMYEQGFGKTFPGQGYDLLDRR